MADINEFPFFQAGSGILSLNGSLEVTTGRFRVNWGRSAAWRICGQRGGGRESAYMACTRSCAFSV